MGIITGIIRIRTIIAEIIITIVMTETAIILTGIGRPCREVLQV
jgi:hypothetical protein